MGVADSLEMPRAFYRQRTVFFEMHDSHVASSMKPAVGSRP
jgi:hypothetical protein